MRMIEEPIHPNALLEHRAKVANAARKEMEAHMARLRVQRALKHKVPGAADRSYHIGQKVYVWREKLLVSCWQIA